MEDLRQQQEMERVEQEKRVRFERHLVWRNRVAVRLLGTDVNGLFLFFAQRIANLAGSRRVHNDTLRENGGQTLRLGFWGNHPISGAYDGILR